MKEKKPWLQGVSIFDYVKDNIDPQGFFTPLYLPDDTISLLTDITGPLLGEGDRFYQRITEMGITVQEEDLFKSVEDYVADPDLKKAGALYDKVAINRCVIYGDSLIDRLGNNHLPQAFKELALTWLYHAPRREAVKFAITVSGLILLNAQSPAKKEILKKDLLLLAKCEEFTAYVLQALKIGRALDKADIFSLLCHTEGWGKVAAIEAYTFTTEEDKDWALLHGCQLGINCPEISLVILKQVDISGILKKSSLSHSMYTGIFKLLNTLGFYLVLQEYGNEIDLAAKLPGFSLTAAFRQVLNHTPEQPLDLDDLTALLNFATLLDNFSKKELWQYVGPNDCNIFLSTCEKLIYGQDWLPQILDQLQNQDGSLNTLTADLAQALHLDIRLPLLRILKKNPLQTGIYYYLLQTENKRYRTTVLHLVRKHLKEYISSAEALVPILKGLTGAIGQGTDIIAAGLTSKHDVLRNSALEVLEAWPSKAITPKLRAALYKARNMGTHPILVLRIDFLLARDSIDMDNLRELFKLR